MEISSNSSLLPTLNFPTIQIIYAGAKIALAAGLQPSIGQKEQSSSFLEWRSF